MFSRLLVWLFPFALMSASLGGTERNLWPFSVEENDPAGNTTAQQYAGPLFFKNSLPGQPVNAGFRPFYLQTKAGDLETKTFLYPLFVWKSQQAFSSFSFFRLLNRTHSNDSGRHPVQTFDLWPFYFSRTTPEVASTYRALFPVYGDIKERFGKDRLTFVAFPLYMRTQKSGLQITHAPWPFLRFIGGAGHEGFQFWPLFGHRHRTGDYDHQFYLWPLLYKSARDLSAAEPRVSVGALPFYTRDTGPGYRNVNFAWPFLGYTHRTAPTRYDEQRYLWPFLVQGRGDQRFINRWAPFYTHSVIKGMDKTWVLWPLLRHARWSEQGVAQEKTQFLSFLYWSLEQRSLANPHTAPARKTHLWPLYSSWDNGAGRRQFQLLSPFEVFFPQNETIRQLYSPLLALYRYDRQSEDTFRHTLLWHAVTYQRTAQDTTFNLGPLLGVSTSSHKQRIAIGRGLFGLQRQPGQRVWRPFLFDFPAQSPHKPTG